MNGAAANGAGANGAGTNGAANGILRLPRSLDATAPNVSAEATGDDGADAGKELDCILRCQRGDLSAFRMLVERYEQRAFWVAYHMVGHAEDAQDVVQEAFLRAYRSIDRFSPGRRFYTWFYQIVVHLAIDTLRKRREEVQLAAEAAHELPGDDPAPLDRLAGDEFVNRVQRILQELLPRDRAILVLRDIEGLTGKEIAQVVRSNHATVRWWLFLARKEFRRRWELKYGRGMP